MPLALGLLVAGAPAHLPLSGPGKHKVTWYVKGEKVGTFKFKLKN